MNEWGYVIAGWTHHVRRAGRLRGLDRPARPRPEQAGATRGSPMDVTAPRRRPRSGRRRSPAISTCARRRAPTPRAPARLGHRRDRLGARRVRRSWPPRRSATRRSSSTTPTRPWRSATTRATRFRLQGTVEDGTIVETGDGVDFAVTFNGVEVERAPPGRSARAVQGGRARRARGPMGSVRRRRSLATACS